MRSLSLLVLTAALAAVLGMSAVTAMAIAGSIHSGWQRFFG